MDTNLFTQLNPHQSMPSPEFKHRLRTQLLQQYERGPLLNLNFNTMLRPRLLTAGLMAGFSLVIIFAGLFGYYLPEQYNINLLQKIYAANSSRLSSEGNFLSIETAIIGGPAMARCGISNTPIHNGYAKFINSYYESEEHYYYKYLTYNEQDELVDYLLGRDNRTYSYDGGDHITELVHPRDSWEQRDTSTQPINNQVFGGMSDSRVKVISQDDKKILLSWESGRTCELSETPEVSHPVTVIAEVDATTLRLINTKYYLGTVAPENLFYTDTVKIEQKNIPVEEAEIKFNIRADYPDLEIRTQEIKPFSETINWDANTEDIVNRIKDGTFNLLVPNSSRVEYLGSRNYQNFLPPLELIQTPLLPQEEVWISAEQLLSFNTYYAVNSSDRQYGYRVDVLKPEATFEDYKSKKLSSRTYGEGDTVEAVGSISVKVNGQNITAIDNLAIQTIKYNGDKSTLTTYFHYIGFEYGGHHYVIEIYLEADNDESPEVLHEILDLRALDPKNSAELQEYIDMVDAHRTWGK